MPFSTASISISSLEKTSDYGSHFTLECISFGSPATIVHWKKDGRLLADSDSHKMTQILQNGATSMYSNLLTMKSGPYALVGNYSCEVSNSLGAAAINISVEGQCSAVIKIELSYSIPECPFRTYYLAKQ